MKKFLLSIIPVVLLAFTACKKDSVEESNTFSPTPYTLTIPPGFPPPNESASHLTVEGVRLGRMLYYDPILSTNGLSCSSCHNQSIAFSKPMYIHPNGDKVSVPAHINLAWKNKFLWEGGASSIEEVCMGDFEPEFFNTDMVKLINDLKNHPDYPRLFSEAFNISDISSLSHQQVKDYIVKAAAQFINTLTSANYKFDLYLNHQYQFTPDELRGYLIFNTEEGDCFHCHGSVLRTDNNYHNNGLEEFPAGQDMGYYNFTHDTNDIGKFLSPTLRNIEFTAPYMHDGRYQTLEEVVDFYNSGVQLHSPNIDPIMTKPFKVNGLYLTDYDKQCLIAFLKTFSDTAFIANPEYSSPF
jgi:cytochrome c peroxidase